MNKNVFFIFFIIVMIFLLSFSLSASGKEKNKKLHPMNIKLIKTGVMPYPKYYPSVPRVSADMALALFRAGKAKISRIASDGAIVMGGYAFKENEVHRIPKEIPLAKGQILLLYCA